VSLGGFFETRETGKARRQGLGQQPGQARYLVTEHERVVDRLLLRGVVLDGQWHYPTSAVFAQQ
jgi:hypothetical protein